MSLIPRGKERRTITRHQINEYLRVYNRNTLRKMGGIGNISSNGLMLISAVPVLVGAVYSMRIILPNDSCPIDFDARCHWCKPDIGPEFFDSGYSIVSADNNIIDLVNLLKEFFTF